MALYTVPRKIGFMIGGTLAGYGLAFIGYQAGMTVTAEFSSRFLILLGVFPAALMLIGAVAAQFFYKISDEDAAMYAKANMEQEQK